MKIHLFHRWGRWSGPFAIAGAPHQQRRCLACNKAEVRSIHVNVMTVCTLPTLPAEADPHNTEEEIS